MSDYTPTGAPADQTRGASATIRSEFQAVATAIATKADAAGETYSGTHDFTGATLIAPGKADVAGETYSGAHDFSAATGVTLPAATSVGNVSATELSYLDGVTSAIQPQLGTKSAKAGDTYSGTHDFSGATAVSVPAPIAVGHAVNKAYADALSMTAGNVPTGGVAGDLLVKASSTNYDADWGVLSFADLATGFSLTGGTTPKTLTVDEDVAISAIKAGAYPGVVSYSARTSNTQLVAADRGKLIDITSGTFTQTVDAAATLGAGWWCYYRNAGTGDITLDPNASETIDGQTSGVAYPGCTYLVVCTGTGFTVVKVAGKRVELKTSGTSWTAPMGVWVAKARLQGGGASGAKGADGTTCFAGGSAGGYCEATFRTAPGTSISYSIGAAGAAVTTNNTAGNSGGNTTFASATYVAFGGTGGGIAFEAPAVGGGASGGDLNVPGGHSEVGAAYFSSTKLSASAGGRSVLGSGGRPSTNNNTGQEATGYGSGGYGSNANFDSGAGMPGCIILEY